MIKDNFPRYKTKTLKMFPTAAMSGGMPWPKTGLAPYHAQLVLLDKGGAITELVVYWVLLNIIP